MRLTSIAFSITSLLIISCCFSQPAAAQTSSIGLKAGFSGANIAVSSDSAEAALDGSRQRGFVGGVSLLLAGNKLGGWQVEALVHQKGTRNLLRPDDRMQLTYLEVPVLLHTDFLQGNRSAAFFTVGPSFAVNLKASYEDEGVKTDIGDDVRRFDAGLNVGGGIEVGALIVEARYTWGLRNLLPEVDSEGTFKNRSYAVTAGWWFGR